MKEEIFGKKNNGWPNFRIRASNSNGFGKFFESNISQETTKNKKEVIPVTQIYFNKIDPW